MSFITLGWLCICLGVVSLFTTIASPIRQILHREHPVRWIMRQGGNPVAASAYTGASSVPQTSKMRMAVRSFIGWGNANIFLVGLMQLTLGIMVLNSPSKVVTLVCVLLMAIIVVVFLTLMVAQPLYNYRKKFTANN